MREYFDNDAEYFDFLSEYHEWSEGLREEVDVAEYDIWAAEVVREENTSNWLSQQARSELSAYI